jgi:predicted nucleotidyltransferase
MSIEYYEVDDVDRVVKIVKEVLERFEFIEIAVLFGSILRRNFIRDIDVGLVVDREISFKEFNEVASTLEQTLNIPVDLVILNDAPPLIRFKALVEGIKIIVRDRKKLFYIISVSFMELKDMKEKLRILGIEETHT